MNIMAKITIRFVSSLQPNGRDKDYFDDELKGFGIRVRKSGHKSYFIMNRLNGMLRRFTIGPHGAFTPEKARTEAKKMLGDLAKGRNPSEAKERSRNSPTIRKLGERFLEEYCPARLKPTTQREYKRSIELFINPMIGRTSVASLTDTNIIELHQSMSDKPYQANRTIGVLSIMMKQAEKWGYREKNTNPCYSVEKFKEKGRERFLSGEELQRLGKALSDFETEKPIPVTLIRLLIFTGCRLSEIQTLQWKYVDLEKRQLNLPDSKTGEKIVYFGKECEQILRNITRLPDNPYVITGALEGDHLKEIQKPWRKIRAAAGLDDVRIHDLRHTFASHGVILTGSLPIVGKLLGHTRPETTARYAHLAADPVREAAQEVSEAISKSLYYTEKTEKTEENLGTQLLELRERLGINRRTVENRTKLDTDDICAIESGDNVPLDTVMAYADAIGYKLTVTPI
tara:strand:- start:161 stop:1528 length:1368 start_codon:yes stop_codon:yes gene_type:complete